MTCKYNSKFISYKQYYAELTYFISDIFKYTLKAWDSYTIAKSMFFNCVQVMNESVSTQISLPKKALQGSLVIRWI